MVFRRFGAPLESFLRLFGEFSDAVGQWLRETFLRLFGKFLAALENVPEESFWSLLGKMSINQT